MLHAGFILTAVDTLQYFLSHLRLYSTNGSGDRPGYRCVCILSSSFLCLYVQLLWNGSLPRAGDDLAATLWRVCGFLAVRLLRVRTVCRTFTILAASQTKKVHSGKYPERCFRVPIGGARAGQGHYRGPAAGTPRLRIWSPVNES